MSECLVLGPEGAGKTLLIRKLEQHSKKKKVKDGGEKEAEDTASLASAAINHTVPTVGVNFVQLKLSKNLVCSLRESGGQMAPLWSAAYEDCKMVRYVIDSSNQFQVSAATILLLDMLTSPGLPGKPVMLFFNKTDSPLGLGLVQYKAVMRLRDIIAHATQKIAVVDGSCWTGEGVDGILEWLKENCA